VVFQDLTWVLDYYLKNTERPDADVQ